MNKRKLLEYTRILLALPFIGGVFMTIMVFLPLADDYGNPVNRPLATNFIIATVGILSSAFALYLAAPALFRRRRGSNESASKQLNI